MLFSRASRNRCCLPNALLGLSVRFRSFGLQFPARFSADLEAVSLLRSRLIGSRGSRAFVGADSLRSVRAPVAPGRGSLALPVTAWTDLPTMVLTAENPLLSNIDPLLYPRPLGPIALGRFGTRGHPVSGVGIIAAEHACPTARRASSLTV